MDYDVDDNDDYNVDDNVIWNTDYDVDDNDGHKWLVVAGNPVYQD